jgi:hypothetical protein
MAGVLKMVLTIGSVETHGAPIGANMASSASFEEEIISPELLTGLYIYCPTSFPALNIAT